LTPIDLIFAPACDNGRMTPMRSRRFAWLALVAMLSLATLPTFGRLGTTARDQGAMVMVDHATMPASMPGVAMATRHGGQAAVDAAHGDHTGHDGHEGHDCAYCVLLSGLATAAVLDWTLPATRLADAPPAQDFTTRRIDAPVPALGGQGPPSVAMG
jgi:hypothetical protein